MYSEHCCPLLVQSPRYKHIIPILRCLRPLAANHGHLCSSSLTSLNMISLLHVSPNLKTRINPLVFAHRHSVYCKLPTEPLNLKPCLHLLVVFAHRHSVYCKLPTESLLRIMGVDAAPILRNSLPLIVRPATSVTSFKSRLKTHLYSFNDALFVLLILVFC